MCLSRTLAWFSGFPHLPPRHLSMQVDWLAPYSQTGHGPVHHSHTFFRQLQHLLNRPLLNPKTPLRGRRHRRDVIDHSLPAFSEHFPSTCVKHARLAVRRRQCGDPALKATSIAGHTHFFFLYSYKHVRHSKCI